LRRSEELFRGAFEHSPIGITLVGLDGSLQQVNAAFARILGYTDPTELTGSSILALSHEDDRARGEQAMRQMLADDVPYSGE
jgi:PAS domain S-box-containing protein